MPIRQSTQIRNSDTYNDTIAPSVTNYETNPTNIEEDLNNLRSAVNNIINALNGNWTDNPFAGGGGAGGTNDLPVSGDPSVLTSLNSIPIACFADVLTDVTVGAGNNFVVLSVAGSEAPSQVGSLSNDVEGVIVAESALSGAPWEVNELTERAGSSAISPNNLVTVRDATTLQPIQSGGRDVLALIQVENGFANGTAFTDVTPQRVKLSFVRINAAGDDLEAVPVADIENLDINYNYPFVRYFKNVDPSCFTGQRGFVDQAASVDVTLQNAYEGGNTITTNVGNGDVTINGTESFIVGGSVTVDFDTTSSISLDADVASNFTVDGDDLTLSTTTAGDVNVTAADALELQSLSGTINLGTDAVASTITVGNTTGATATSIVAGTGLNSISTTNVAADGAIVRLDNGGVDFAFFAGTGAPNGVVTPTGIGDLYTETTTGQLWQNTDGLITGWVQFGSAAASTLEEVIENTGASPATLGGTSGPTTFEVQIQDLNTFSFESFASDTLIAMNANAAGDSIQIGHGGNDTLNVVSDTVNIVTGSYSMQSSSSFLVRGATAGTVETTGAGADLDIQTTGAGSALNLRTTNTTSAGSPVNISAADNSLGQGNNVNITAGSQIGGIGPAGGGFVTINAGDGIGSTIGGNVEIAAGEGGTGGDGGAVTIDGGAGGATSGNAGAATIRGGDSTDGNGGNANLLGGNPAGGNNAGGNVVVQAGNSQGTVNGGVATVSSGNGGATGDGGLTSISAGNGGSTSGDGGSVNIDGGNAPTSGNGGNVNITGGFGDAASSPGFIQLATTATNSDENDRVLRVSNAGTNGETFDVYSGTSDPSGVVTALTGSLWVRDDGATGEMYINTSAGGSGTTWELFQTGAGATTLQTAYENGNTIVTSAPEGPLDVSGTEAISLDAQSDSNFSVAGAALTIETTGTANTTVQSDDFVRIGSNESTGAPFAGGVAILTNGTTEAAPGLGFNTLPTDTNSAIIGMSSGTVSGTGTSGVININSGAASGSGASGNVTINSGQNTGTGISGTLSLSTGGTVGAASGPVNIFTGGGGTASGNLNLFTSNADDAGDVLITTGDSDGFSGGAVQILTGDATSGNNEGGAIVVIQGNGSGTSEGGSTSWQTGNGGDTGDGGQYTVSTGNGGTTSGNGGDVLFFPGDATTSGIGGSFGVTCGNGATAGDGGSFSASAGNGGATGNGGGMSLTAGDGGTTSGNGGTVNITGGSAITSGDGGNINIIAGASDAASTPGSVLISTAGVNLDEEDRIVRFRNAGTNGETFDVYSGASDPSGVVTALTGSLWVRDDGSTGELYINTSAGGSGTTWQLLQSGGGNSLQQAYVQGNTIVTSAAEGNLDFSGTEQFIVDMDDSVSIRSAGASLAVVNDNTTGTGSALFGTGTTTGGNASGNTSLVSGDGGSGSDTGQVTVNSGNITNGAGTTGNVIVQSGNAIIAATGSTGSVTISSGTSTAASAGAVSVNPGTSGAGAGAALNLAGGAGDTTGGNVNITGGASNTSGNGGNVLVAGGAPTSGAGGNVQITGTAGAGTNQNGGNVILVPGAATGTGTNGIVGVDSNLANTSPVFALDNSGGTDGNNINQFVSEVAPEGVIAAPAGSITFVDDGGTDTDGQLWLKTSGTGNTGWEQLSTAASSRPSIGQAEPGATPANTPILLSGLTDLGGGTIPSSVPTGASFVERVRVFINGVLQISSNVNGSTTSPRTVAASTDTVLGDAIELSFALFAGDILTLEVYPA